MRYDLAAMARRAGERRSVITCRPIHPPLGPEVDYRKALLRALDELEAFVREEIVPAAALEQELLTADVAGDRIGGLFRAFRRRFDQLTDGIERFLRRLVGLEAERHTERFTASVKAAIGIDLSAVIATSDLTDSMSLAVQRNVGLIRGLSEELAKRLEQTVLEHLTDGGLNRALEDRLVEEFGFARRRAKLIARDQTAKLTSDLNRFRQVQAGITSYTWETSKDERVRKTHRANQGKVFRWDSPPAATGHPGHDINCRCVPIPLVRP